MALSHRFNGHAMANHQKNVAAARQRAEANLSPKNHQRDLVFLDAIMRFVLVFTVLNGCVKYFVNAQQAAPVVNGEICHAIFRIGKRFITFFGIGETQEFGNKFMTRYAVWFVKTRGKSQRLRSASSTVNR
jgi:hypothetical protein